ncbi:unnamed protein product [Schistosoma turkestanicum]|nr:unnamed protein product [Schistosoma turkestanicum]
MVRINFYPSRIPLYAVCHALFWLPVGYFVAISNDHVQPVVPYVSSLGVYPPERYMFMSLMGSYGVMTIISQWLWSIMMIKIFKRRTKSMIGQVMCIFSAALYTVLGICIVILSFIDTKHNNRIHYRLTVISFVCHTVVVTINTSLVVFAFRPWKWFVCGRILVLTQMGLGSYLFRYFNKAGLRVLAAKDPFYIKRHEPGYEEFKWSAVCEWVVILSYVQLMLITGLEMRKYEKTIEKKDRKYMDIWTV